MAKPDRRSPLFHRRPLQAEGGVLRLAERPFLGKFILRADPREAANLLLGAIGLGLPVEPLGSGTSGEISLLWMGPDEWMLVTSPEAAEAVAADARATLSGIHHQFVAVSDYYTTIEVAGSNARDALAKLTTLDLHPRAFRVGMVAGSLFGRANAMIWHVADDAEGGGPLFRLMIRWSMADYLWCLVARAGHEWGVPEERTRGGERLTIS